MGGFCMKRNMKRIISVLMAIVTIICMGNYTYAHSGRTDANGGHRDNNNKSGLGSYHYHCGGHPAHLHTNGVCPYSSSSSSSKAVLQALQNQDKNKIYGANYNRRFKSIGRNHGFRSIRRRWILGI